MTKFITNETKKSTNLRDDSNVKCLEKKLNQTHEASIITNHLLCVKCRKILKVLRRRSFNGDDFRLLGKNKSKIRILIGVN